MMIEVPKRIAENIDQFTGRAWLLPKLLEWCDERKKGRIFLLMGSPCTGKSMILAWLVGSGPEPDADLGTVRKEGVVIGARIDKL